MTEQRRLPRAPWFPGMWKGLWVIALLAASSTVRDLTAGFALWRVLLSALASVGCFLAGWLVWRHEQRLLDGHLRKPAARRAGRRRRR